MNISEVEGVRGRRSVCGEIRARECETPGGGRGVASAEPPHTLAHTDRRERERERGRLCWPPSLISSLVPRQRNTGASENGRPIPTAIARETLHTQRAQLYTEPWTSPWTRERGKQVKLELPVCSYLFAVATSVCMIP